MSVPAVNEPHRVGDLAVSLEFDETRVKSGETLRSQMVIENVGTETVSDAGCTLSSGRYALVPKNDPDAELWVIPRVNCGDPPSMSPGFRAEWPGPDFLAHTKYGEPLPPGEYLAVLDIEGLDQPLQYPIRVQ